MTLGVPIRVAEVTLMRFADFRRHSPRIVRLTVPMYVDYRTPQPVGVTVALSCRYTRLRASAAATKRRQERRIIRTIFETRREGTVKVP